MGHEDKDIGSVANIRDVIPVSKEVNVIRSAECLAQLLQLIFQRTDSTDDVL